MLPLVKFGFVFVLRRSGGGVHVAHVAASRVSMSCAHVCGFFLRTCMHVLSVFVGLGRSVCRSRFLSFLPCLALPAFLCVLSANVTFSWSRCIYVTIIFLCYVFFVLLFRVMVFLGTLSRLLFLSVPPSTFKGKSLTRENALRILFLILDDFGVPL